MKVTIKNENKSSEIKYPCLMSHGYVVVLFSNHGSGTIMYHPDLSTGHRYDGDAFDMDLFTPFTGTVELSND